MNDRLMNYQELFELIPSPTLQRDLESMLNGIIPSGYSVTELDIMWQYLNHVSSSELGVR